MSKGCSMVHTLQHVICVWLVPPAAFNFFLVIWSWSKNILLWFFASKVSERWAYWRNVLLYYLPIASNVHTNQTQWIFAWSPGWTKFYVNASSGSRNCLYHCKSCNSLIGRWFPSWRLNMFERDFEVTKIFLAAPFMTITQVQLEASFATPARA